MSIEKFAITGTKDADLISTCEFLLSQIGTIKTVETDAKKHMLVFHSYGDKGNAFPINVTATILAEAVRQFIADTPAGVFEEMLSGYEESYGSEQLYGTMMALKRNEPNVYPFDTEQGLCEAVNDFQKHAKTRWESFKTKSIATHLDEAEQLLRDINLCALRTYLNRQ